MRTAVRLVLPAAPMVAGVAACARMGAGGGGGDPLALGPEGVAGSVTFDEHGDPVDKRFTMGVIQGGTIALPEAGR